MREQNAVQDDDVGLEFQLEMEAVEDEVAATGGNRGGRGGNAAAGGNRGGRGGNAAAANPAVPARPLNSRQRRQRQRQANQPQRVRPQIPNDELAGLQPDQQRERLSRARREQLRNIRRTRRLHRRRRLRNLNPNNYVPRSMDQPHERIHFSNAQYQHESHNKLHQKKRERRLADNPFVKNAQENLPSRKVAGVVPLLHVTIDYLNRISPILAFYAERVHRRERLDRYVSKLKS
jgi:hypothetical protein